jgi:hypothetical protein
VGQDGQLFLHRLVDVVHSLAGQEQVGLRVCARFVLGFGLGDGGGLRRRGADHAPRRPDDADDQRQQDERGR